MARSEARISVTIWTDPDFLALDVYAQRMFMFLLSQPDLAHDGVLALRERRWSKSAANLTRTDVEQALASLAAARFVVVDEDAEELLIRSFIRRDKVYRQPNVLRAAADHLAVVTSSVIRAAIADELRRIAVAEDIHRDSRPIVAAMLDAIGNPSGNPSPDPSRNPSGGVSGTLPEQLPIPAAVAARTPGDGGGLSGDTVATHRDESNVSAARNPSGNPSGKGSRNPSAGTPGERGVVTVVSSGIPVPRSSDPVPRSSRPPRAAANAREARESAEADFANFWATYPRRVAKAAARKAWDRAIKRAAPTDITAAAARYRDQPGREERYTAHPATWLNGDRWEDAPPAPPGSHLALVADSTRPPQSTADKRFAVAMELAAQFAEEEAS